MKVRITVLVVDDQEDNRAMYAEYLRFTGCRVRTARDGKKALQIARSTLPDVIALDLSMPIMDGWELARRLKSDERTKSICIIALTGHAEPAHVRKAKEAGCDHFIAKPCLPSRFAEEMLVVLEKMRLSS